MFHALFRKKENEEPSVTPLEKQRDLQIERMIEIHPNAVELVKFTDYRIPVVVGNSTVTLIILLPPYFPQDKPEIQVTPPVVHPWVNEHQQVTGCASLKDFNMHSDLSKVIQDIINEFHSRNPLLDVAAHPLAKAPPPPFIPPEMSLMVGIPAETAGVYVPTMGPGTLVMDVPCCFPELKDYSIDELKKLNEDESRLEEFVDKLPILQMVDEEMDNLGKQNEELARENISQEPRIEACKRALLEKVDQLAICRNQYDEYNARFQELVQIFLPSNIREQLKFYALKSEEDSENIALKFLENKMETENFLHKFMELRTKYHLRRVKEEKLHQQLLAMQKSNY